MTDAENINMTGSENEPKMTRHLLKNVKELEKAG